jgi:hypothetical protein
MMTPDEPYLPRAVAAGGVNGLSGLWRPQCGIGRGQRQHRSACENGGKAKVAHQGSAGDFCRRCDMIAVASAMMVGISLVAIRGHLIGIVGRMAFGDLFARRLACANAGIRPFQRVRRRRRSKGADEHEAGKDVQQASHGSLRSSNADDGIVMAMARLIMAVIARLSATSVQPGATRESLRRVPAMPIAGR